MDKVFVWNVENISQNGSKHMNKISVFLQENGIFLTIQYIFVKLYLKIRNFLISLKLKSGTELNIGLWPHLRGLSSIQIGKNFSTGVCFRLEAVTNHNSKKYKPSIVIKDNVAVSDFVHIGCVNYVEIGNNVLIGSKVYITDHGHGSYSGMDQSSPNIPPNYRDVKSDKKVVIADNVWIGDNVSILPGVFIGKGSVIGANSLVSRDIPPFSIAVGTPAFVIKKYNEEIKQWVDIKK